MELVCNGQPVGLGGTLLSFNMTTGKGEEPLEFEAIAKTAKRKITNEHI